MDTTLRRARVFDASSPVLRYWLANCVGFSISGSRRGKVEAVLAESDPTRPETLLVRTSRRRVRSLPVSAVVAVVPGERRLLVARPAHARLQAPELPRVNLRPAVELLLVATVALSRLVVLLSRHAARLARRAWELGAPIAAAQSKRAWKETRRLIASVPWHRFGPSVRSATTRAWQELSRRWSLLRTTSSPPSNVGDSPAEANTTSSG